MLFLFWCVSLLAFQTLVSGQITTDKLFSCSAAVKRCQMHCLDHPGNYIRWTIHLWEGVESCIMYNSSVTPPPARRTPLYSTFDVQCCPNNAPEQRINLDLDAIKCLDEKKLDTLFILGVATLGSIMLMSAFILIGLILYKRRSRSYAMKDGKKEDTHSLIKGSDKTASSIINMPGPNHINKAEYNNLENSSQTLPYRYQVSKQLSSEESRIINEGIVGDYQNRHSASSSGFGDDRQPSDLSKIVLRSNCEPIGTDGEEKSRSSSVKLSKRMKIAGNYEVRGGFITPIYANSDPPKEGVLVSADESNLQTTDNEELSNTQPRTGGASKTFDSVEDDYIQAPPLKSLRSQPKQEEEPTAYQKLMPSPSSQKEEPSDYNTLLHNSQVSSGESKAFTILNNNMNCKNKCDVTLVPSSSHPVKV